MKTTQSPPSQNEMNFDPKTKQYNTIPTNKLLSNKRKNEWILLAFEANVIEERQKKTLFQMLLK